MTIKSRDQVANFAIFFMTNWQIPQFPLKKGWQNSWFFFCLTEKFHTLSLRLIDEFRKVFFSHGSSTKLLIFFLRPIGEIKKNFLTTNWTLIFSATDWWISLILLTTDRRNPRLFLCFQMKKIEISFVTEWRISWYFPITDWQISLFFPHDTSTIDRFFWPKLINEFNNFMPQPICEFPSLYLQHIDEIHDFFPCTCKKKFAIFLCEYPTDLVIFFSTDWQISWYFLTTDWKIQSYFPRPIKKFRNFFSVTNWEISQYFPMTDTQISRSFSPRQINEWLIFFSKTYQRIS